MILKNFEQLKVPIRQNPNSRLSEQSDLGTIKVLKSALKNGT